MAYTEIAYAHFRSKVSHRAPVPGHTITTNKTTSSTRSKYTIKANISMATIKDNLLRSIRHTTTMASH